MTMTDKALLTRAAGAPMGTPVTGAMPIEIPQSRAPKQVDWRNLLGSSREKTAKRAQASPRRPLKHIGKRLANPSSKSKLEDGDYLYDITHVSAKSAKVLQKEADEMVAFQRKVAQAKTAQDQATLQKKMIVFARKYEMRQHPETGVFVHALGRIQRVEMEADGKQIYQKPAAKTVSMAYYTPKYVAGGSRGIKRGLVDIYNHDPAEIERTTEEKIAMKAQEHPRLILK